MDQFPDIPSGASSSNEDIRPARKITNWIIRIALLIIVGFLGLCIVGAFQSEDLIAEASVEIDASAEQIFPYLSELEYFSEWSPWYTEDNADIIIGGSEYGTGQLAAWTCRDSNCTPGTQDIIIIQQNEFVQAELNLNGEPALATYAMMVPEDGSLITVFMETKMQVGGFPYIKRTLKTLRARGLSRDYKNALDQLKTIVQSQN